MNWMNWMKVTNMHMQVYIQYKKKICIEYIWILWIEWNEWNERIYINTFVEKHHLFWEAGQRDSECPC